MFLNKKIIIILFLTILFIFIELIFPRSIKANDIDNITLKYEYSSISNTVTIVATSKIEFKQTKPTWTLSSDKKIYRKTYFANESYYTTFTLKNGNSQNIKISITQIDEIGPSISINYQYDSANDMVTVTMKSNEEMSNTKPTWTLSADKLTYTKKYYKNESYYTDVKDKYGNNTRVKLNINQIKGPQITMQYNYDEKTNTVTAVMKSNKILAATKPTWELSKDKLTYTKKFDINQSYTTSVQDIYGNIINVKITITQIQKKSLNGIDVSKYNGTIDWSKVKSDGIDFAMIRAGYRGWEVGALVEDTMLSRNVMQASANNIKLGLYFFSQAITVTEAKEEAQYVISLVKKYGIKPQYPITIDTELTPNGEGRADNLSIKERTAIVKAFCDTILNSGYVPMIYANKYWLMYQLDMSQLSNYDVWLAHYTTSTDYKGNYTIWQYTDKGIVSGISGNVDKNYCYKNY